MCTITEVLAIGKKLGLEAIAITDHHPSIDDHGGDDRVRGADFAYFNVFCQRYKNLEPGIELLKGIELNILDHEPWITAASQSFFEKLDFRLGGIHLQPHLFQASDHVAKNTDAILGALHAGAKRQFEIMSHPIIFGAPFDHKAVVLAAKERSIALEVNNSFFPDEANQRKSRQNIGDLRHFFELAAAEGAYISIGSDAHVTNEVGTFTIAIDFLAQMDFPTGLIVNRDLATFRNFCAGRPLN